MTATTGAVPPGRRPSIAQVVPDIPTFAVDDGFSYAIPNEMDIQIGSLVRVPLGGRTVRGYVVGVRSGPAAELKPISRITGSLPIFHPELLTTLRWLAVHYVAPLPVLLAKAGPPNLPGAPSRPQWPDVTAREPSPLRRVSAVAAAGGHERPHYLLGRGPWALPVESLLAPVLGAGRSALVVMPTVAEAEAMAESLREPFGDRVLTAYSALEPRVVTRIWSRAARWPGHVVVGTRELALWPVAGLGLSVVVEEGRRAMKDRQTPTLHVRESLRRRAAVERHGLVFFGHVPTTEVVASGMPVDRLGGTRVWPLVEVIDRTEEPPGAGLIASRTRRAIGATVDRNGRIFVFSHRRGYAPAFRCTSCRLVRRCDSCHARAGRAAECERCGAALGRCSECGQAQFEPLGAGADRIAELLGRTYDTGPVGSAAPVWVGTERDLPAVGGVDLAVVVDADGLIHAPHYRAGEDALRIMARVAATVAGGRGRRAIVQTGMPADPVIEALRHGDPLKYLEAELERRSLTRLPPAGEVIVVELSAPGAANRDLLELTDGRAELFGPAPHGDRFRWLIQGADLTQVRVGLRRLVQGWREAEIRVRVDVDPLDL